MIPYLSLANTHLRVMARGLCVIASNVGGMRDILGNGQDGILIPAGDAYALADAVIKLLAELERARQIGRAARLRAREYTWERVAQKTATFYEELIERKWMV